MEQADGTSTSGNTKIGCAKSRKYFITFWTKEYPHELPVNCNYMCTCEDTTKDGKYHGHAFIYFKNPVAMSRIKKLFGNDCHVEQPMKNSDCIDYVLDKTKRKHDFQELGKRPMNNGIKLSVYELSKCDDPGELDWKMYNTWQKIKNAPKKMKKSEWNKDVKVYYIWGPSGIGKSTKAHEMCDDEFEEIKHKGDFYLGVVDGTGCCIYDDFRDSHMNASEFINFIDYRIHNMNIKGGCVKNKYNKIIITSIQNPKKIYRNVTEEQREQWLRRMEIIDMNPEEESDDEW